MGHKEDCFLSFFFLMTVFSKTYVQTMKNCPRNSNYTLLIKGQGSLSQQTGRARGVWQESSTEKREKAEEPTRLLMMTVLDCQLCAKKALFTADLTEEGSGDM